MTAGISAVSHRASVRAAPGDVYRLVADAARWPVVFGPTIHVEHLDREEFAERFAIWALVNGSVARWTSSRAFDPDRRRITFQQEQVMPPAASMGGTWEFRGRPPGTEVVLRHEFSVLDGSADDEARLREAIDRNSDSELGALRQIAEAGQPAERLFLEFEDTTRIAGPVAAAYDFIYRAEEWERRLPHVRQVSLAEPSPGIQRLTMETATGDGAVHTTTSVRVCAPNRWIAYKQTVAPAPLLGHSGIWTFRDLGRYGCLATARHLVLLDPAHVAAPGRAGQSPVSDVAARVRSALSGNSEATLGYAREFAERTPC